MMNKMKRMKLLKIKIIFNKKNISFFKIKGHNLLKLQRENFFLNIQLQDSQIIIVFL